MMLLRPSATPHDGARFGGQSQLSVLDRRGRKAEHEVLDPALQDFRWHVSSWLWVQEVRDLGRDPGIGSHVGW